MLSKIYIPFLLLLFSSITTINGQNSPTVENSDTIVLKPAASPSVEGSRRSKGMSFGIMLLPAYTITSNSLVEPSGENEIRMRNLEVFNFKLKAPVLLKRRTKIILGFKYRYEEYNVAQEQIGSSVVFSNLKDKKLNSLSFDLYVSQALHDNKFLLFRGGYQLNGDYSNNPLPVSAYSKYVVSGLYGWQKDRYTAYGFGLYFNYNLGRPAVYPAFLWNRTFNEKWGIESILPAIFNLRYNFSEKSILIATAELEGNSYHIMVNDPPLDAFPNLELRRSDILTSITFEQEIYDFLWFSLSAGFRNNINFDVSESNSRRSDVLLKNRISPGPFVGFSVFLVPPRKLETRALRELGD